MTTLYKIFCMLLNSRLDGAFELFHKRALTQCGFKKHHGTNTALFALHHAVQSSCTPITKGGLGRCLYVCFVDFRKAFDSVCRRLMLKRVYQLGVRGHMLHAIQDLYRDVKFQVKVNGKISEGYIVTVSGVRQGCPVSPVLFGI